MKSGYLGWAMISNKPKGLGEKGAPSNHPEILSLRRTVLHIQIEKRTLKIANFPCFTVHFLRLFQIIRKFPITFQVKKSPKRFFGK